MSILLTICVPYRVPYMMAYSPDNFLAEYRAEGYDMTFNDQHENIFLIVSGLLLIVITRWLPSSREICKVVRFSGIAITLFGLLNMLLGAPYDRYLGIYLNVLIFVCLALVLIFKKKFGSGKIFISLLFLIGAIICSYAIDLWDYRKCDRLNQHPPEYGLQWRPFYQGFTDDFYFSILEKKIDPHDGSKILNKLLYDEPHSFEHPFDLLKKQGWEIAQSEHDSRLYLNPDKTIGYIQTRTGGGLAPPQCYVYELKVCFPSASINNITELHQLGDCDDIIVLTTEVNDTIKLYLKNLTHDYPSNFINLKDSILLLSDSEITDIIHFHDYTYSINENYFEKSKVLSFPRDTIEHIEYEGPIIRVTFKNPEAKDKIYSSNCMVFVDNAFESGEPGLHRF